MRRTSRVLTLAAVASLAMGCGYTSKYVPPFDGRARAVWKEDRVAMDVGGRLPRECAAAVGGMAGGTRRLPVEGGAPRGMYWAPRYYGPPIVVLTPGLAPHVLAPPLFAPRLVLRHAVRHTLVPPTHAASNPQLSAGGGNGDLGKAAVVLAVVALVVLPIVDVSLALAPAENASASVLAMNQVAAYNDLARQPGTPCSMLAALPEAPVGAP